MIANEEGDYEQKNIADYMGSNGARNYFPVRIVKSGVHPYEGAYYQVIVFDLETRENDLVKLELRRFNERGDSVSAEITLVDALPDELYDVNNLCVNVAKKTDSTFACGYMSVVPTVISDELYSSEG